MSNEDLRSLEGLSSALYDWGHERNFYGDGGATIQGQLKQLATELVECAAELDSGNLQNPNFYMELGDILVTALMTCHVAGAVPAWCLGVAYEKIKDRKGQMIKGKFVKESDLGVDNERKT